MELKIYTKIIKIPLKDIVIIISIIISIISLVHANNANKLSNQANSIAMDANNISLTILSHQEIIEESDLQIGTSVSAKNNLNETFIRVPIINGYYAKYPASIIVERINIYLNDNMPIKLDIESHYNFLISKDKPTYFDFVFSNSNRSRNNSDFGGDIIIHLPIEKIKEKSNYLLIKIPYDDFTLNGNENKMIFLSYYFDFMNGSIEVTERNVSRVPIKMTEYKTTI